MEKKKVLIFFGTRPEAIKMAPVVKELQKSRHLLVQVVVSAQHRGMLDQVLKLFQIKSQIDLNIMKKGQSLFDITINVLARFEKVIDRLKPDLVLVHGDTTTTMAGALAAFYKRVPIGHVEAGLRTRDLNQPYPEEMNRRVADVLMDLYFCPTAESKRHLLKENHSPGGIFVTGNTVIDALLQTVKKIKKPKSQKLKSILKAIGPDSSRIVLMTAHRRENFGAPFERIFQSIKELAIQFPSHHWIYPVHPNPNVLKPANRILSNMKNIHLIAPLDYGDLVYLLNKCLVVMTDSGGLQEEAPSIGKPVLVFREVTERPEAVKSGTVRLVGANPIKIKNETIKLFNNKKYYRKMANAVNPYGDGLASKRIREAIEWWFKFKPQKPNSFRG